jgi:myo-inositol-1(or 4)-monophosphatase
MPRSSDAAPVPAGIGDADWLGVCREAARRLQEILAGAPTTAERAEEAGRGEAGDRSLVIDRAAEAGVFSLLDELHAGGHRFTAVSEERGEVDYGDPRVLVVIDPIDGSLNAKRDLPHHAISIAVADGPTMADVAFAYVYDYGPREEWVARRGGGATLDGVPLDPSVGERRNRAGALEVVGIESADPRWVAESIGELRERAHRLRALGAIAISLCQVAAARMDAMLTLKRCRAFDAAAGQLIVREAGGHVAFTTFDDPLAAPLDLLPHSPVVAARTPEGLAELLPIPRA